LPEYTIKVSYTYPVCATNAEDAFSTVPQVIKMRYIGVHAEVQAEVMDAIGKRVLLAKLNLKGKDASKPKETKKG